jgi:hypothetical protein
MFNLILVIIQKLIRIAQMIMSRVGLILLKISGKPLHRYAIAYTMSIECFILRMINLWVNLFWRN